MKKIILALFLFLLIFPAVFADEINEIKESLEKSKQLEQQIKSRNFFMKLFFGSDWQTAKALEQETLANKERIEELKTLTNETKQIEELEKENERIYIFAVIQGKMRGLFGWFKS